MHRRLRVLTLVDSISSIGGAERVAAMLAMRLDPQRFERFLCVTRCAKAATLESQLAEAGVRLIHLERRSKLDLLAWRGLTAALRGQEIDVIHAHMLGSNVWGTIFGRVTRVPVVIAHEHGWAYEGQHFRRFLDREVVSRLADAFVAVSAEDRRRMIEVERIPPVRIRLIPNGIPPLVPSGHDVRAELSLRDVPLIGTVCELRPEKAVDLLVDATAALRRDRLPVQLVIVGDGPEETRLRAQISARGLDEAVHLMGRRDDVPDILAALDVAVCCSDFEGTPLSVVEYMAAGLPIVATQVGGLPELVHDGENGLLVERRDTSGLAAAIGKLLRDAELRRTLGETGRERQRRELGLEAMVAAFEELYLELYARSKRPR